MATAWMVPSWRHGAHGHRPPLGQERLDLGRRHLDGLALVHAMAHGLGHRSSTRCVRSSVTRSEQGRREQISSAAHLLVAPRFTARSPRLRTVDTMANVDRRCTDRALRSVPGPSSRHHGRDGLAEVIMIRPQRPERAGLIGSLGHHSRGSSPPRAPGDDGAINPPSAVVACPSHSSVTPGTPQRRCLSRPGERRDDDERTGGQRPSSVHRDRPGQPPPGARRRRRGVLSPGPGLGSDPRGLRRRESRATGTRHCASSTASTPTSSCST